VRLLLCWISNVAGIYQRITSSWQWFGPDRCTWTKPLSYTSEHGAGNAWVATKSNGNEVVFRLAGSRSRAHAEALLGNGFTGVGITDGIRRTSMSWATQTPDLLGPLKQECQGHCHPGGAWMNRLGNEPNLYRDLSQRYMTIRQYGLSHLTFENGASPYRHYCRKSPPFAAR